MSLSDGQSDVRFVGDTDGRRVGRIDDDTAGADEIIGVDDA